LVVSSFLLKTFSSRHILHSTFRPNGSHLILFFKPFLSIGLNFHPKMLFPKFLKNCLQSAFQKSDQSPEIFSLSVKFSLFVSAYPIGLTGSVLASLSALSAVCGLVSRSRDTAEV
jgi:hypothetical protein